MASTDTTLLQRQPFLPAAVIAGIGAILAVVGVLVGTASVGKYDLCGTNWNPDELDGYYCTETVGAAPVIAYMLLGAGIVLLIAAAILAAIAAKR